MSKCIKCGREIPANEDREVCRYCIYEVIEKHKGGKNDGKKKRNS